MALSKFKSEKEGYKICSVCGVEKPATLEYFKALKSGLYGVAARCKECDKDYRKSREKENKIYFENYYQENKPGYRERYLKNKESCDAANKRWYQRNKEKLKIQGKDRRIANKDKINKYHKKWRLSNPEKYKIYQENNRIDYVIRKQTRRAKELNLEANFTKEDWIGCLEYFNYTCAYCGTPEDELYLTNRLYKYLQQDHFIPVFNGGAYTKENILPACKSCNSLKHKLGFEEWYTKDKEIYSVKRKNKIYTYFGKWLS